MNRDAPEPPGAADPAQGPFSHDRGAPSPFVDLEGNPRIPILMQLVGSLSDSDEPSTVLNSFVAAMRRLDGPRSYLSLQTQDLPRGHYRIARWLSPDGREHVAPSDPWQESDAAPVHTAGILADVVASPTPKLARNLDLAADPVLSAHAADMRSLIAVPFLQAGAAAAWTVLFHPEPDALSIRDLETAILRTTLIGATASTVLANHRLRAAAAWIQSEIDQIAQIQRGLLPQEEPDVPGLSFAAHYATFDRAGGDYYDLLPLRHLPGELPFSRYTEDLASPWAIIIADASGHGPSAAVIVAMLHAILHGFEPPPDRPVSPAAMLEHISRRLFARRIGVGASFVTAFLGIYDPVARTLTYANAGHHPPLLCTPRTGGAPQISELRADSGTPLGIRDHVGAHDHTVALTPGQTLLLYTDGVVEAADPARDQFGIEALKRSLADAPDEPHALLHHTVAALRDHESSTRPRDDQTLVALKVL